MTKTVRILALFAAVTIVAAKAQADEKKYRFEFFGAACKPLEKKFEITSPQTPVPVKGTQSFSEGGGGGVRVGIDGHNYWGQDYSYSYHQNASRLDTAYGRFAFTNRFHQVSTNILFYPAGLEGRKVFPYVTAGLGATFMTISEQTLGEARDPARGGLGEIKSETVFAFNAGAGVRFRASERFGVRFELRDYMSRAFRYGLPKASADPNAVVLPTSGVFHQFTATAGIVIHF